MKKKSVDIAILDFTKAFDKVPHRTLLHKLNYYGIRGSIATWLENFLTYRIQQVVINGTITSSAVAVTSGVPEGTGLGPLLFLVYINDLPDNLISCARLFADDCILYTPIKSVHDTATLQNDLKQLEKGQNTWLMNFNPKKCSTMTISIRQRRPNRYTFCGQKLASR